MQPRFHDRPDEAQDAGQNENAPGEASLGEEWNAGQDRADDRVPGQNEPNPAASGDEEADDEPARTWAQARGTGGNGDTGEQPAVTNGWPPPPPVTPVGGALAGGPFQGGPFDAPPPPGAVAEQADRPEEAEQPEQGEELTPEEEARAADAGEPVAVAEPAEAGESDETAAEPVEAAAEPARPAEEAEAAEPVPAAAPTPPVAAVPALAADREELLGRWREVQASFVDDPLQAVNDADALVGDAVDALIARLNARRQELGIARQGGSADTEQLRQALRSYRDLLNVAIGS